MFLASFIHLVPLTMFVALLGMAVQSDLREYRIPNRIPLAILALFPVWSLSPGTGAEFLPGIALAGAVLLLGLGLFAVGVMGGGDIKLIVAVSPWMGWAGFPLFLIVMGLAGAGLALFQTSRTRLGIAMVLPAPCQNAFRSLLVGGDIPYAVAIASGALAALAFGPVG